MKRKYILGLDIGITSVGYGIIDYETRDVIDAGVRLFKEANVENNEGRRSKRGTRRLKRRRRHRLQRVKKLLSDYNLLNQDSELSGINPYEARVKGLSHELSAEEFCAALLHLAKRRGVHNVNEVEEDTGEELSTKEQITRNSKALKEKHVAELQLERLKVDGEVRGAANRFKTSDYVKEAKQLLDIQQAYHQIDQAFIDAYIDLLEKRRYYYEGPGKGSPFGWKDIKEWYEMLMGRCTYFPEELRSVKYAYNADLHDALNDLNNLIITRDENEKLEYYEKYHIIENVFKQKKKPTLKQIAKEISVNEEDIKGYRVTSTGKPSFTNFKVYHDIKGITSRKEILENAELLNQIAEILTIYQSPEDIQEELAKRDSDLTQEEIDRISNLTGYTGTHRLSLKAINLILDELWHTSDNQMEIFTRLKLVPKKLDLSQQKAIPTTLVDDFILSPVVKRSFIQSIKVINAIIKKYGLPNDIIIELARERNSKDAQKIINEIQKRNRQTNERIEEIIRTTGKEHAKTLIEKIKLHDMQEGKCLYSLESIPLEDLLNDQFSYDVDHIIPRSVSFDNSFNNKVLVKREENSKKGNRTPFQYLSSSASTISYETFKKHILNLAKGKDRISKKKKEYLLEERDINRFSVQKDFINRNLVDTRYATRELMTLLRSYFRVNDLDVKVKSINGGFTSFLRNKWTFKKERNQGYKHHAEDALVIANADFIFKEWKKLDQAKKVMENQKVDEKQAESTSKVEGEQEYEDVFKKPPQIQYIKDFKDYKYSHRVDKKPNRELVNDTIYSTRKDDKGNTLIINNLKGLYDKDNDKLKKLINKAPDKLLMYHHDPQTYQKLKLIMEQYGNEKNPLYKYYEETGNYLTKYSKKDNGPVIKKIKYYGKKLNTHRNITGDYPNSRNKVVKLSLKPYRFDVYLDNGVYKFVTVKYLDVIKKEDRYEVNSKCYKKAKKLKKISEQAEFIASFYYNDLIQIDGELYRVIGVNNDLQNRIEVNMVDITYREYLENRNEKKTPRIFKTIASKTQSIKKHSTDILGNIYEVKSKKRPQMIMKG
ncbi:type II CRISPR RNA-guided endonuclease Cas9 [Staphylococcus sp. SQ8-PEA]|uniref:CRISPR-associated endonuclease Cas9 n=1 Tax=Staphylococcus marylandisciuri TaxID=2981529 RepID=A0ABT2QSP2_9STAP|nr:type II CRISPR RNA-guided endonuclease Cas9 [Staphylococcus marylandisciuri]MCU5746952.1 type II CRISPR RNA-guided endonuclease Cas9 [Staphylococcus marylandisciuri]